MADLALRNPIPLPLEVLVPPPDLFLHDSYVHGQLHVARVLLNGFVLLDVLGFRDEAPRLWSAIYLHDLARTHDGRCHRHGADAVARLGELPGVPALFANGGVRPEDHEAIATAVTHHSLPQEIPEDHPYRRLTALLKDADALDRVRLGDLDESRLRFAASRALVPFATALYRKTSLGLQSGRDFFPRLWEIAQSLCCVENGRSGGIHGRLGSTTPGTRGDERRQ